MTRDEQFHPMQNQWSWVLPNVSFFQSRAEYYRGQFGVVLLNRLSNLVFDEMKQHISRWKRREKILQHIVMLVVRKVCDVLKAVKLVALKVVKLVEVWHLSQLDCDIFGGVMFVHPRWRRLWVQQGGRNGLITCSSECYTTLCCIMRK